MTLVKANCNQEGKRAKMCINCGKTLKTEKVKRTAYDLRKQVHSEPTCTKEGLIGWYCNNPDCVYGYHSYYKTEKIKPLGHNWSAKTYAATCTTPNTIIYTCSRCHAKKSRVGSKALGHKWGKWKLDAVSMVKKKLFILNSRLEHWGIIAPLLFSHLVKKVQ